MKAQQAIFAFAVSLLALNVSAAGAVPASEASPVAERHSAEEASATIRKHHLQRLSDHVNIEPGVLQQRCRYESEISSAPPEKTVLLSFDDGPEPGQT